MEGLLADPLANESATLERTADAALASPFSKKDIQNGRC
jgi:hypothetical protein